jgi:hypothetical protein
MRCCRLELLERRFVSMDCISQFLQDKRPSVDVLVTNKEKTRCTMLTFRALSTIGTP